MRRFWATGNPLARNFNAAELLKLHDSSLPVRVSLILPTDIIVPPMDRFASHANCGGLPKATTCYS